MTVLKMLIPQEVKRAGTNLCITVLSMLETSQKWLHSDWRNTPIDEQVVRAGTTIFYFTNDFW